jgi:hypothetical protein
MRQPPVRNAHNYAAGLAGILVKGANKFKKKDFAYYEAKIAKKLYALNQASRGPAAAEGVDINELNASLLRSLESADNNKHGKNCASLSNWCVAAAQAITDPDTRSRCLNLGLGNASKMAYQDNYPLAVALLKEGVACETAVGSVSCLDAADRLLSRADPKNLEACEKLFSGYLSATKKPGFGSYPSCSLYEIRNHAADLLDRAEIMISKLPANRRAEAAERYQNSCTELLDVELKVIRSDGGKIRLENGVPSERVRRLLGRLDAAQRALKSKDVDDALTVRQRNIERVLGLKWADLSHAPRYLLENYDERTIDNFYEARELIGQLRTEQGANGQRLEAIRHGLFHVASTEHATHRKYVGIARRLVNENVPAEVAALREVEKAEKARCAADEQSRRSFGQSSPPEPEVPYWN